MKKIILLSVFFFLLLACKKKKDPDSAPQPQPEKTSSLTIQILKYDSLGYPFVDHSGVNVSLYNTSFSALTPSSGVVNFGNVPAKLHIPLLFQAGFDAAPFSVDLSNATSYTASGIPVAKISPFAITASSFSGQFVNKDSITVSFNLNYSVPSGQYVKLAVLTGTNSAISANNFLSADVVLLTSSSVVKRNIAKLPELQSKLNALQANTNFYIKLTTVSYGIYESNLYGKMLLGDHEVYSPHLQYQKNW
jgi:hypothetical protein